MVSTKIVCVLLLAIGASQAASVAVPPQEKTLIDVAQKVIAIVRIVGDKLQQGIAEAKPIIIELEALLQEDLANDVHKLLTTLEETVTKIVTRIEYLEKEIEDAIAAIEAAAKACLDELAVPLDAALTTAEASISVAYNKIKTDNNANITDIITQVKDLVAKLDKLNDDQLAASVKCVVDKTDVKACLDTSTTAFKDGIVNLAASLVLLLNQALPVVSGLISELVAALIPIGQKLVEVADPSWAEFGTCVEASK